MLVQQSVDLDQRPVCRPAFFAQEGFQKLEEYFAVVLVLAFEEKLSQILKRDAFGFHLTSSILGLSPYNRRR